MSGVPRSPIGVQRWRPHKGRSLAFTLKDRFIIVKGQQQSVFPRSAKIQPIDNRCQGVNCE